MFSTDFLQIEIGIYFVVSDPLIFINIDMPFLYQIWCKFVVHISRWLCRGMDGGGTRKYCALHQYRIQGYLFAKC